MNDNLCVNTTLTDKHYDDLENIQKHIDLTIEAMIIEFDLLKTDLTKEELEYDLLFSINQFINLNGYNLDGNDIMEQIFEEFEIEGAK